MIAFTIIIAILFLVGLKSQDFRPFDKDKVVVLKPFLALGIVLSHLSWYSIYLHDFQRWGALIVGIFFFISGYGLSYSLHYKVGYIRNFFLHRIAKALLLPYMGALLFYFVLNGNWSDYSFFDHISRVSGPSLIPNDWFVFALVYCYMVFGLERNVKHRHFGVLFCLQDLFCSLYLQPGWDMDAIGGQALWHLPLEPSIRIGNRPFYG